MKHATFAVMLGLALAGCSSSEDEPTQAFCTAFVGPTPAWTPCNASCARDYDAYAYDADLNTTTKIAPVGGAATYTTMLTASSTADIPWGGVPGVFLTQPTPANFVNMTTEMRTIHNGVEQEVLTLANRVISYPDNGSAAVGFLGMRTTKEFDQLEFKVSVTFNAGQVPNYYVYEICSDGGSV